MQSDSTNARDTPRPQYVIAIIGHAINLDERFCSEICRCLTQTPLSGGLADRFGFKMVPNQPIYCQS